jgi:hypothetical protein
MPEASSIKRNIRNERKRITPDLNQNEGVIDDLYKYDSNGDLFVRKDILIGDMERIIILASKIKTDIAKNCETISIDGNFRTIPHDFSQLLVVNGIIFGGSYPLFYCLLQSKAQKTYEKAFELCQEIAKLNPKNVVIDFEKSLYNATKKCCQQQLQKVVTFILIN